MHWMTEVNAWSSQQVEMLLDFTSNSVEVHHNKLVHKLKIYLYRIWKSSILANPQILVEF